MNNQPPFRRGQTRFEGSPPDSTSDSGLEGRTYEFEDLDWGSTAEDKPRRSGRRVKVMVVRNVSSGVLHGKDLMKMKITGSGEEFLGQVISNAPTLGDLCFPADEFLPSGGVAINDLFYVVIGGPATVTTDTAGTTTITIGLYVVPGGGTAGRVVAQDTNPVAGTATFVQINGSVGRAVTATAAISTDLIIDVQPRIVAS